MFVSYFDIENVICLVTFLIPAVQFVTFWDASLDVGVDSDWAVCCVGFSSVEELLSSTSQVKSILSEQETYIFIEYM